jgi:BON domain
MNKACYPHPIRVARARFAVLLTALLGAAGYCPAPHAADKPDERLKEVVISATRQSDERVTRQVEETLANDPWIYAEHITVTTDHGVVRLQGLVQDTGEWLRVLRLSRRIPGARRVVDELEQVRSDPDGGG